MKPLHKAAGAGAHVAVPRCWFRQGGDCDQCHDVMKSAGGRGSWCGCCDEGYSTKQASDAEEAVGGRDSIPQEAAQGNSRGCGYEVQTSVDGVEAFTALREAEFDLVISVWKCPAMNGFDLTSASVPTNGWANCPLC